MFDVNKIRQDFPMLNGKYMQNHPLVYLDNSATTFKPYSVIEAVNNYYINLSTNAHRGDYDLSHQVDVAYENTRKSVARFINCDPKEVVFTSGTTMSLNLIAKGFFKHILKEDDVILLTLAEHASNVLPWFEICEEVHAKIEYIPLDEHGRVTIDNVKKALHDKVKLVSIAQVSNVLGNLVPVKEIGELIHAKGGYLVVDGAQSVPHLKTDVKDLNCDFLAFSAHKMLGPTGVGVLYGKFDLLEKTVPLNLGGGSNARFLACGQVLLKNPPYKFEAGTPNIEGIIAFDEAIKYLEKIGMENIHNYEMELKQYLKARLKEVENITIYNLDNDSGILTFNVNKVFAQDCATHFNTKGVCVRAGHHCAKILRDFLNADATVRMSLYFYNTKEEIDIFIEALKGADNFLDAFF